MDEKVFKKLVKNWGAVLQRIEAASKAYGRSDVTGLLAVSKRHGIEKIEALYQEGQIDFGENYLQEALEKMTALQHLDIRWHFIGPVQSNKTRSIAENFDWVQSVDRIKVLRRLNEQRPESKGVLNVLLQYKVGDELSKSGADQGVISEMIQASGEMQNINCRGLMCIPPHSADEAQQCKYFAKVKKLYDSIKESQPQFDTLSIGMSGDLESAIKMGSTMVRVGTDIFGVRSS